MKFLEKFKKTIYQPSRAVNSVGVAMLVIMIFLITIDVILRYSFNLPVPGSFELIQLMMLVLVYCAMAYATIKKGHISIDIIVSHAPERTRAVIDTITSILSLIVLLLIVWSCINFGFTLKAQGATTMILKVPIFPFIFIIAFGMALTWIAVFNEFIGNIIRMVK